MAVVGREPLKCERVVADLSTIGAIPGIVGDVSSVQDCQRMVDEASDALGPLDILVNVAGVFEPAAFVDVSEKDFDYQFDINV